MAASVEPRTAGFSAKANRFYLRIGHALRLNARHRFGALLIMPVVFASTAFIGMALNGNLRFLAV